MGWDATEIGIFCAAAFGCAIQTNYCLKDDLRLEGYLLMLP
jgi:hypothetical protein